VTVPSRTTRKLAKLPPGVRADLLRVLTSPSDVRADLIRQCYERPHARWLGDLLIDMEEDDFLRAAMLEALRQQTRGELT